MLEALILGVCLGGYECGKATEAYYKGSPQLQSTARKYKATVKKQLGQEFVVASGAAYAALTDRAYKIRLYRPLYLQISKDRQMLLFTRSF